MMNYLKMKMTLNVPYVALKVWDVNGFAVTIVILGIIPIVQMSIQTMFQIYFFVQVVFVCSFSS